MDEETTGGLTGHRLDATAANRLAQEINDAAQETNLAAKLDDRPSASVPNDATGTGASDQVAGLRGDDPVESQQVEQRTRVFPPNIHPTTDIGDTPEAQGALRDEYTGR